MALPFVVLLKSETYNTCSHVLQSILSNALILHYDSSWVKYSSFHPASTICSPSGPVCPYFISLSITFSRSSRWIFLNVCSGSNPNSRTLHSDFAKLTPGFTSESLFSCYSPSHSSHQPHGTHAFPVILFSRVSYVYNKFRFSRKFRLYF